MDKWCPAHGTQRVLVSDDAEYYRAVPRGVHQASRDAGALQHAGWSSAAPTTAGCARITCSIPASRSWRSPITATCAARSASQVPAPKRLTHKPLSAVLAMLDAVVANEGAPDVVQISGGEPTLHPDFFAILDAARARPIRHLMVNTNGIRIAAGPRIRRRASPDYRQAFEIYLQFDSFEPAALKTLRGADLTRIHAQAIERLNELDISTTLVMTLKKDLNDGEIGESSTTACRSPACGASPCSPSRMRAGSKRYDSRVNRLTVSEIRRKHRRADPGVHARPTSSPCPAIPTHSRWVMRSSSAAARCRSRGSSIRRSC